jgi:hypothetical protein
MTIPRCAFALFVLLLAAAPVEAQETNWAGRVKVVSGAAVVVRDGREIPGDARPDRIGPASEVHLDRTAARCRCGRRGARHHVS